MDSKRKVCAGCQDNQPAQEAHYGGCLRDPQEERNKRTLADLQGLRYGARDYPSKKNKN